MAEEINTSLPELYIEFFESEIVDDESDIIEVEAFIPDASQLGLVEVAGGIALSLIDRALAIHDFTEIKDRHIAAQKVIAGKSSKKELSKAQRTESAMQANLKKPLSRLNASSAQRELGVSEQEISAGEQEIERELSEVLARGEEASGRLRYRTFRTAGTSASEFFRNTNKK